MMMQGLPQRLPKRQTGAALVVGLVLLMVLTILGVSGMTTSKLEVFMAGNKQFAENAFQAAETGINRVLESGNFTTAGPVVAPMVVLPNGDTVVTNTSFQIATPPPPRPGLGFSQGLGGGGFSAFHFEIDSSGTSQRGAVSAHNQGFFVIGPGAGP